MSGFLCSMVGATFTVAAAAEVLRSKKGITAFGNAQIDTAQSKFGGASALFDGTGDYLTASPRINLTSTDNFTLECWIRVPNITGDKVILSSFLNGGSYNGWSLELNNATVKWWNGSSFYSFNSSIAANTWYHIAIVSTAGSIKMYQEGVEQTTTSSLDGNTNNTTTPFYIGIIDGFSRAMNGHIDEIRVSNSVRYTTTFTPSTTPFVNDANTLLLIHANGTDASTFFEDDNGVRAPKGISAIGNAQVDTAQSKFGGASALFDGTGDYLTIPYSADITRFHDNTNFTIEYWIRIGNFSNVSTGGSNSSIVAGHQSNNGDAQWWSFGPISDGNVKFYYWSGSANQYTTSGVTLVTNTWYHLAFVKQTNSLKIYVDGVERGSGTISNTPQYSTSYPFILGSFNNVSFNGYLDEFRISNTARYTANFTAPTQPFVNDANTLLLIHADGTDGSTVFRDDNGALANRQPKYITAVGNAQVDTAQSQFGGASALFDGTGDYLQLGAYTDLNFGTNNFTVEFWINFTNKNNAGMFSNGTATYTTDSIVFGNDGGTSSFGFFHNPGGRLCHIAHSDFNTGTWYHIAATRSGNTFTMYLNGVAKGSSTYSGTINFNANDATRIGMATWESPTGFTGYIDEFRISNSVRYTAAFTPSTVAFTNDANTLLLIHADGVDATTQFYDDTGSRMQKGIQAVGNAQVDTAQSKFGGASALFDGTDDELIIGSSSDFAMGTGDWTIEFWVRTNITGNQDYFDYRPTTATQQIIYASGANLIYYQNGAGRITGTSVLSSNTWHHIALARSGTSTKMFVDGTQVGSTWTDTVNYNGVDILEISNTALGAINGHMDELRWSKGIARYTANFTAPTAPFQNDSNTVLLLHMDGTDASTVFTDDNGIAPYTP